MRAKYLILGILIILLAGVTIAQEESTCELDATEIVTVVESVCTNTGNNELCYGNNDVEVAARSNAPPLEFDSPGDIMSLTYVQSLYLSALNRSADLWGVAQMRLVTTTVQGPQEVTLLLYGDVEVDNAVDPTLKIPIETTASINIRSIPRLNGAVIASAPRGTVLEAVGRMADNSWVRVIVPETEAIGWLSGDFVQSTNGEALENLDIMEANENYFGPMQAFYINTGTNLSCDNVATDGLIIQTPDGVARVTILINEVTIELVSLPNSNATALIQANTLDGMTISMISGASVVSANNSSYHLSGGMATNIAMTADLRPDGEFSPPTETDGADFLQIPILTIIPPDPVNPTNVTDASGTDVTNGTANSANEDTADGGSTTGSSDGGSTTGSSDGGSTTGTSNGGSTSGTSDGSSSTGNATGNSTGNATGNSNGNSNGRSSTNGMGTSTGASNSTTTGTSAGGETDGNGNGNANGNANGANN